MDRSALVVEDDAFTRTLIREVLEGSGFTVFEADSAASALKAVDRVDPDGLVVDVDLGLGPTGLDLIEALGERRAEFGILVLSNYPAQTARVAGLRPGVGHLLKQMPCSATTRGRCRCRMRVCHPSSPHSPAARWRCSASSHWDCRMRPSPRNAA
jgi:DNA-binding response OmpR family regulator